MKKSGIIALTVIITVIVVGAVCFVATSRAGYETAAYEVIESDGDFEIRQYEPHLVAATPMAGANQNDAFGRLFRYISGENEGKTKIAMTTPVFMPSEDGGAVSEMQFVVPADIAEAGAPDPGDPTVTIRKVPGGTFAVIRYSGRSDQANREKHLAVLKERLTAEGRKAVGGPVFAGYDPPWTPGPMRRNEVMLKIE